jgi:hypothetical protein
MCTTGGVFKLVGTLRPKMQIISKIAKLYRMTKADWTGWWSVEMMGGKRVWGAMRKFVQGPLGLNSNR